MLNCYLWLGGEVVTRESAKLLCRGSIPLRASKFVKIYSLGQLVHRLERFPDKKEARGSTPRLPTFLAAITGW